MHRRLQLVLLALVAILGHSAGALAEDTLSGAAGIAPELNATYTFISATGDDKLFVDTGDKTARVTWGAQIHGDELAKIDPKNGATGPSAKLHVADVKARQGDSLYSVWGIIVQKDAKVGKGKAKEPEDWNNFYEKGGPWILLEINKLGNSDDYVWLEDIDATLSVRIVGAIPNKSYTVTIVDDNAPGDVDTIVLPRAIVGPNDTVTVPVKGLRLGTVGIRATTIDGAEPGSITPQVIDCSVKVTELSFTSDHRLMHDNSTNYKSIGNNLTRPDWVLGIRNQPRNQPISHTMGKQVTAVVTISVVPTGAPPVTGVRIVGKFPPDLPFDVGDVALRGGLNRVQITTKKVLPSKIHKAEGEITWTVHRKEREYPAGITGSHVVYVTYDTPRATNDSKHKVTIKRMERAIATASGVGVDPHTIAQHVVDGQADRFDVAVDVENAWEVPDGKADCQSIVRYAIKVLFMVGVPGEYKHVRVYATKKKPEEPIVKDAPHQGLCVGPLFRHPTELTWFQGLTAGADTFNCYEAALKFSYDGRTRFYAGGILRQGGFPDALAVLRTFRALSWYTMENGKPVLKEDIHVYLP